MKSLLLLFLLFSPFSFADNSATILLYHHVSDKTPASTSISPKDFELHLKHLSTHHTVVALEDLVTDIKNRHSLPDNAVAITFDDGFRNVLLNAHPLLKSYGFPYTVFINPSEVGTSPAHMNWDELQLIAKEGALIANHYWDHRHLLQNAKQANWKQVTRKHIEHAESSILEHLGKSPRFFAYPFGEYNQKLVELLKEMGITGFVQHSGALGYHTDLTQIPRFPAAGIYSNLKTLAVKLRSLSMPVLQSSISEPAFYQPQVLNYSLTIDLGDINKMQFACYFNGQKVETAWTGNKVQVSSAQNLKPGRSRVNCTAPSQSQRGRYYWHSQPWFIADNQGRWLD